MHKKSPRHLARSLAVQGIYFYKLNQVTIVEIEEFLRSSCHAVYPQANYDLMHTLLVECTIQYDVMLHKYTNYLKREIKDINLIEQIILVIAAVELHTNLSVPSPVIINEAVELSKLYGAEESYKFINGLVDKLAKDIRCDEILHYKK